MKAAALVLSALLLLSGVASAQDDAVDGEYRLHDEVTVTGYAAPLVGTILEGRDPSAQRLKIKTVQGVITEVERSKVVDIKDRETPASAFTARAGRLEKRKAGAAEHRLLAEWAYKQGLLDGAEAELTAAADGEPDAARATAHRERLIELLERRLPELAAESIDAVHEKILRQVQKAQAAGATSPRLELAKARVALSVGMPEVARAALGRAIAGLDAALQAAPPPPTVTEPGTEAPAPATETEAPPPRRTFKGGRDGVGLDEAPKQPVLPPPAAPEPAQDNSDVALAGLEPTQRDAWREALLLDADAAARLGQLEDAQAAWERLLEVWPQERQATLGLAQLLVSLGGRGQAIDLLGQTLKVFPRDAELLLVRGQLRTLAADLDGARQDLELALAAATRGQASPPPGTPPPGAPVRAATVEPIVREVKTALGLVLLMAGKFDEARVLLEAADVEPGYGPARLARALLTESQGNVAAARTHYEEAARLLAPADGEARYGLAFVRAAGDDPTGAVAALRDALRQGHSSELVLRALEDLARRRNDGPTEAKLLEVHVRSTSDPSPDLLSRLARAWQFAERFDEARVLLQRGLADSPDHLGCLRGLAWDAYRADDREKARALFERVVALGAKDQVKDDWAARALKNLEDVRTRRVWTDGFDRAGPDVKNSWIVEHSFGVEAGIADGKLYLHGKQHNGVAPDGRTRVRRVITGEQVVKVEARLNLDALGATFRGGLRLEASNGPGVVLFKDQDGRVKVSVATRKGDFSDPVDLGDCPAGLVTFGIELTDPKAGLVTLWVGGQPRGEPQKVPGLAGEVDVSVYVQGSQLGAETKLTVDEVRVFAVRAGGR